jgi:putative membrane protein
VFWWWGNGGGWVFGVLSALFWIGLVVVAVVLLRNEIPHLRSPEHQSPALRLLEERYARGEITREEFLERRAVLIAQQGQQAAPSPDPPATSTQPPATPPTPYSPPPAEPTIPENPVPTSTEESDPDPEPGSKSEGEPPGPSVPPGAAESLWSAPGDDGGDATEQLPSR